MRLRRYLSALSPIRRRAEIAAKADALITEHGADAYDMARALARQGRAHGKRKDSTWTKVALRIAALSGRSVGAAGSDRRPPL